MLIYLLHFDYSYNIQNGLLHWGRINVASIWDLKKAVYHGSISKGEHFNENNFSIKNDLYLKVQKQELLLISLLDKRIIKRIKLLNNRLYDKAISYSNKYILIAYRSKANQALLQVIDLSNDKIHNPIKLSEYHIFKLRIQPIPDGNFMIAPTYGYEKDKNLFIFNPRSKNVSFSSNFKEQQKFPEIDCSKLEFKGSMVYKNNLFAEYYPFYVRDKILFLKQTDETYVISSCNFTLPRKLRNIIDKKTEYFNDNLLPIKSRIIGFRYAEISWEKIKNITKSEFGQVVKIESIVPNSIAQKYGLEVGDIIYEINNKNYYLLRSSLQAEGKSIELSILRDKKIIKIKIIEPLKLNKRLIRKEKKLRWSVRGDYLSYVINTYCEFDNHLSQLIESQIYVYDMNKDKILYKSSLRHPAMNSHGVITDFKSSKSLLDQYDSRFSPNMDFVVVRRYGGGKGLGISSALNKINKNIQFINLKKEKMIDTKIYQDSTDEFSLKLSKNRVLNIIYDSNNSNVKNIFSIKNNVTRSKVDINNENYFSASNYYNQSILNPLRRNYTYTHEDENGNLIIDFYKEGEGDKHSINKKLLGFKPERNKIGWFDYFFEKPSDGMVLKINEYGNFSTKLANYSTKGDFFLKIKDRTCDEKYALNQLKNKPYLKKIYKNKISKNNINKAILDHASFHAVSLTSLNEIKKEKKFKLDSFCIMTGLYGHLSPIKQLLLLRDNKTLLSVSNEAIMLTEVPNNNLKQIVYARTNQGVGEVRGFSKDGRFIYFVNENGFVTKRDKQTLEPIATNQLFHDGSKIGRITPDNEGKYLIATVSDRPALKILDPETLEVKFTFIANKEGEWILVSEAGFFNASKNGAKLLNVAKGLDVFPVDRLYQTLYRPDLIEELWNGDPFLKYKEASRKLNLDKILESNLPPEVSIKSPQDNYPSHDERVDVTVQLIPQKGGVGRVEWRVNGVTLGIQEAGKKTKLKQTITLVPGPNYIEVVAYNKANLIASEPAKITVDGVFKIEEKTSDLHVLAVGINNYANEKYKLKFALPDVKAITASFSENSKKLFGNVHIHTLLDEEVTKENIADKFAELSKEVGSNDVFVLYLAGHGKTSDGEFYFLPHNFQLTDETSFAKLGIAQAEWQNWLSGIASRKSILMYDTCESGTVVNDTKTYSQSLETKGAMSRFSRAMGRAVLSASASDKLAFEGYRGHGLFTYVILDALKRADIDNNGSIEIKELADYLALQVPSISLQQFDEQQVPQIQLEGVNFSLTKKGKDSEADIAEVEAWTKIEASKNPYSLKSFIRVYPEGSYVPLARLRMRSLDEFDEKISILISENKLFKDEFDLLLKNIKKKHSKKLKKVSSQKKLLSKKPLSKTMASFNGSIGINIQNLPSDLASSFSLTEKKGIIISKVKVDTPAYVANLIQGDIIISISGKMINSTQDYKNYMSALPDKKDIKLVIWRAGEKKEIQVGINAEINSIARNNKNINGGDNKVLSSKTSQDDDLKSMFDKAIVSNPKDVQAYINRGLYFISKELYQEAINDYDEAIRLKPEDAEAYNNRAWSNYKLGKSKKALPDAERAVELNPKVATYLDTRGRIYGSLGRRDEAIADLKKAVSLDPQNKDFQKALDKILTSDVAKKQTTSKQKNTKTSEAELEFWKSVKDTKDPDELKAYIDAYPDGKFSTLAKLRLKKIK